MIKIYGIPNCNKIRDTRKLLDSHRIPYEFIDVRTAPLDAEQIRKMSEQLGLKQMFNTKGSTYRRLKLDYDALQDGERLNWLEREQAMIRRPLIENAGHYHIGYDEESIIKFVRTGS